MTDQPSPSTKMSVDHVAPLRETIEQVKQEVAKVIVGQDEVIDQLLLCLLCRGHAVLVGVPGLAKTLLISTLSRTVSLSDLGASRRRAVTRLHSSTPGYLIGGSSGTGMAAFSTWCSVSRKPFSRALRTS